MVAGFVRAEQRFAPQPDQQDAKPCRYARDHRRSVEDRHEGAGQAQPATLRMIQSAIKDRDIANRGIGKGAAGDDEVLQILAKMVKQREELARHSSTAAGRSLQRRSATKSRSSAPSSRSSSATTRSRRRRARRSPRPAPRAEGHGPRDGRAEGEVRRPDGFRQGERHRQVAAAVARSVTCPP